MISEKNISYISLISIFLIAIFSEYFNEPYLITLLSRIIIFSIAAIGLNLVLGFGNLISFGHAAFFGLGGYVSGILAIHAFNSELLISWPFLFNGSNNSLIIWLFTIFFCSLLALLVGVFSLRTSGVYFIMITLAFAQMLYYFAISWPSYGGEDGFSIYVRSTLFGINTMKGINFFFICFFWLLIILFITSKIVNSPFGLALRATRFNLTRVRSVGINPFRIQLIAFVLSGAITGIAGSLYVDLNRFVSPSLLSWQMSGEFIVFILIGGLGRIYGPLIGAAFFVAFEQFFGSYTEHWQIFLGIIIISTVLFAKGGIIGFILEYKKNE